MDLQKVKKQNGITLIALIVTIVVLLILAGIAISSLIGDSSIIRQAKRAETEYIKGSQAEQDALDAADNFFYEMFDRKEFGRKIGDIGLVAEVRGNMVAIRINVGGYTSVSDYLVGKGKDIIRETDTNQEKKEFMLNLLKMSTGGEITEEEALEMVGGNFASLAEAYDEIISNMTKNADDSTYLMITAMYFAGAMTEEEADAAVLVVFNQIFKIESGISFKTPAELLEFLNSQNSSTQHSSLKEAMGEYYWIMADMGLLTQATRFVIDNPDGTKHVLQGFNILNAQEDLSNGTDIIYMYNAEKRTEDQLKFKVYTEFDSEVVTIIFREKDPTTLKISTEKSEDENVDSGLDVSFVAIKSDSYIEPPTTTADVIRYMTYEEKWELGIALVNEKAGTNFESKEEAFEFMNAKNEEEFWALISAQVPYMTDLDTAVMIAVSMGGYKIDENYVEEFNKKYNSLASMIDVSCNSENAEIEYKDGYGISVYRITKNGEYTFEMSYQGKVIDTMKVKVNNLLEWSEPYTSTTTYTDQNGKKATIPKGFKVAISSGYNTVDDGLLVKSPEGSTYVWIPCTSLAQPTKTFTEGALNGTSFSLPAEFSGSYTLYARDPVTIPNLDKYGGFYIGRYETSLQNGIASSVRTYAADKLIRGVGISNLITPIRNLYETNPDVGSQLMTGGVYEYLERYTQKGTSTSTSVIGTGREPSVSTYHIYNLHDNLWEVTTAVISAITPDGEYFDYEDCPVMYGRCSIPEHSWGQGASYPTLTDCSGGRICLYIK